MVRQYSPGCRVMLPGALSRAHHRAVELSTAPYMRKKPRTRTEDQITIRALARICRFPIGRRSFARAVHRYCLMGYLTGYRDIGVGVSWKKRGHLHAGTPLLHEVIWLPAKTVFHPAFSTTTRRPCMSPAPLSFSRWHETERPPRRTGPSRGPTGPRLRPGQAHPGAFPLLRGIALVQWAYEMMRISLLCCLFFIFFLSEGLFLRKWKGV